MNVYFCGSEDIDFNDVGMSVTTAAGFADYAWVRSALFATAVSTTWPLTQSASNPTSFGNLSSFWVHDSLGVGTNSSGTSDILYALADNAGVARILIRGTGTAGQVKISSRNAAGTIVDFSGAGTASGALASSGASKIDIFVNYSASGQVQLYINGVLAADTGAGIDVTTNSATSLSFIYLGSLSSGNYAHSQVIVADSDTRAAGLWLMNSNTAGNAQTFTGTATNVNKSVINDATYISAASSGLISEYKTGGIALPSGSFTVPTVKMSSRALVGTSGPAHLEYVTRVAGTDYTGGSWAPVVGSFTNDTANYMQATNPATSAAWGTSDLTASTFNYGVESVT